MTHWDRTCEKYDFDWPVPAGESTVLILLTEACFAKRDHLFVRRLCGRLNSWAVSTCGRERSECFTFQRKFLRRPKMSSCTKMCAERATLLGKLKKFTLTQYVRARCAQHKCQIYLSSYRNGELFNSQCIIRGILRERHINKTKLVSALKRTSLCARDRAKSTIFFRQVQYWFFICSLALASSTGGWRSCEIEEIAHTIQQSLMSWYFIVSRWRFMILYHWVGRCPSALFAHQLWDFCVKHVILTGAILNVCFIEKQGTGSPCMASECVCASVKSILWSVVFHLFVTWPALSVV